MPRPPPPGANPKAASASELGIEDVLRQAQSLLAAQPALAERHSQEILRRAPAEPRARLLLGMALRRQDRLEAALDVLSPLAAEHPGSPQTLFEAAQCLAGLGRPAEAAPLFQSAAALAPDFAPAWRGLGLALLSQEKPVEAEAALETALGLTPGHEPTRYALAAALLRQGKTGPAQGHLGLLLASDPADARYLALKDALQALTPGAAASGAQG